MKKYTAAALQYNREYRIKNPWSSHLDSVRARCRNKNSPDYRRYGGVGISTSLTFDQIRALWIRDKAHLLKEASIDRIDSKGNYDFYNCRFIEHRENTLLGVANSVISRTKCSERHPGIERQMVTDEKSGRRRCGRCLKVYVK